MDNIQNNFKLGRPAYWVFHFALLNIHVLPHSYLLHLSGKIHASFSLLKSILRSPGGKLFSKLVFILIVRLHDVKTMVEPVALLLSLLILIQLLYVSVQYDTINLLRLRNIF